MEIAEIRYDYFSEKAKRRCGWEFISLKRPKYGTAGDLFY